MKNNLARARLKDIPSVDLRCPVGTGYARGSVNYRPMPDGSIQKRYGYKQKLQLPDAPSCIASVCCSGQKRLMAVAGDRIYDLNLDAGTCEPVNGSIGSAPAESALFNYRERLVLLDGGSLRLVTDNGFEPPLGYVPLYGRNWHPKYGGEIFESRNLLTNRIRIHYLGASNNSNIYMPSNAAKVVRVEVDGQELTNYTKNSVTNTIGNSNFSKADCNIVVWYELSDQLEDTALLNSCLMAEVVGSGGSSAIFCSKSAASPHSVFRSTPVSAESLAESQSGFPDSDEFYFPQLGKFSVGSDDLPVTALLSLDDRIIIYNSDEAWLVPSISERIDPQILCREIGCSSYGAAVICGELPAGLCGRSVYAWEPDLEAYNELIAVCISAPVSSLISNDLGKRGGLITDRENRELWLFDPEGEANSPILIYNRDSKRWYTYEGPVMNTAFWHAGHLGWLNGRTVYVFDPALDTDCDGEGSETAISSSFGSAWLDLDAPESLKLARRLTLKLEGSVTLTLEYDNGDSESLAFSSPDNNCRIIRKRLQKQRFRQVRISLNDDSPSSGRIYELVLEAEILEKTP